MRKPKPEGLCIYHGCRSLAQIKRTFCAFHLEQDRKKKREIRHQRRLNKLCWDCGAPSLGKARCPTHQQRERDRVNLLRKQRREAGLCVVCAKPILPPHQHCAHHARLRREEQIRRQYNLSALDFSLLFKAQGGKCAICLERQPLAVDHCHKSNLVRGLLCHKCNRGLGIFKDTPERLRRAADYLEKQNGLQSLDRIRARPRARSEVSSLRKSGFERTTEDSLPALPRDCGVCSTDTARPEEHASESSLPILIPFQNQAA